MREILTISSNLRTRSNNTKCTDFCLVSKKNGSWLTHGGIVLFGHCAGDDCDDPMARLALVDLVNGKD